jgi:hypothetical protein
VLGRFGLPRSFERVTLLGGRGSGRTPLVAVVRPTDDGEAFDADVVDADGFVVLQLRGYRSTELPGAVGPDQVQTFRVAAA